MDITSSAGMGKPSRYEKMICSNANAAVPLLWLYRNRRSMRGEELQGETIFYFTCKRNLHGSGNEEHCQTTLLP